MRPVIWCDIDTEKWAEISLVCVFLSCYEHFTSPEFQMPSMTTVQLISSIHPFVNQFVAQNFLISTWNKNLVNLLVSIDDIY